MYGPTDFPTPTSSVHFLIHIFELESLAVNSVLNLSYMYSRYIFHTHTVYSTYTTVSYFPTLILHCNKISHNGEALISLNYTQPHK